MDKCLYIHSSGLQQFRRGRTHFLNYTIQQLIAKHDDFFFYKFPVSAAGFQPLHKGLLQLLCQPDDLLLGVVDSCQLLVLADFQRQSRTQRADERQHQRNHNLHYTFNNDTFHFLSSCYNIFASEKWQPATS